MFRQQLFSDGKRKAWMVWSVDDSTREVFEKLAEFRPAQIIDLVDVMGEWLIEYTKIDPSRADRAVLKCLQWLKGEALLQGLGWNETLEKCTAVANSKPNWHVRTWVGPGAPGDGRQATSPEQRRAHCIGRSQKRGASPRFWYIVPPVAKS